MRNQFADKNLEIQIAKEIMEHTMKVEMDYGRYPSKREYTLDEAIDVVRDIVDRFEKAFDDGKTIAEARLGMMDEFQLKAIRIVQSGWGILKWGWARG
jgi:hypothetical protein